MRCSEIMVVWDIKMDDHTVSLFRCEHYIYIYIYTHTYTYGSKMREKRFFCISIL